MTTAYTPQDRYPETITLPQDGEDATAESIGLPIRDVADRTEAINRVPQMVGTPYSLSAAALRNALQQLLNNINALAQKEADDVANLNGAIGATIAAKSGNPYSTNEGSVSSVLGQILASLNAAANKEIQDVANLNQAIGATIPAKAGSPYGTSEGSVSSVIGQLLTKLNDLANGAVNSNATAVAGLTTAVSALQTVDAMSGSPYSTTQGQLDPVLKQLLDKINDLAAVKDTNIADERRKVNASRLRDALTRANTLSTPVVTISGTTFNAFCANLGLGLAQAGNVNAYMAVGSGGKMYVSVDGRQWIACTTSESYTGTWNGCLYSHGKAIVWGTNGEIHTIGWGDANAYSADTSIRRKTGGANIVAVVSNQPYIAGTNASEMILAGDSAGNLWGSSSTNSYPKIGSGQNFSYAILSLAAGKVGIVPTFAAVIQAQGIRISQDNGNSWLNPVTLPNSTTAHSIIYTGVPGMEWLCTGYGASPYVTYITARVFKSSDCVNWTQVAAFPINETQYIYLAPIPDGAIAYQAGFGPSFVIHKDGVFMGPTMKHLLGTPNSLGYCSSPSANGMQAFFWGGSSGAIYGSFWSAENA